MDKSTHGFGLLVRQHRRRLDLTQTEFAHRVGCSLSTLKKIESEMRRPSRDMLARLALVLGLSGPAQDIFLAAGKDHFSHDLDVPATASHSSATLRTTDTLPHPGTQLIGRAAELARLTRLLSSGEERLIEIIALGGMGKTHLALTAAKGAKALFADGVHYVNMSAVATPQQMLMTISHCFGISDIGDMGIASRLAAQLQYRQALIVLDAFEQVPDAHTTLFELISSTLEPRFLVTSRQSLNHPHGYSLRLRPLSLAPKTGGASEAVELLQTRVEARGGALPESAEMTLLIAELCARLSGIPLALTLAAPLLLFMTPAQLLARLAMPFEALQIAMSEPATGGEHGLEAILNSSYDALGPTAQCMLRWMSLFVGGCDLALLHATCATQDGGLPALERDLLRLINAGFVERLMGDGLADTARFGMHDLLREFAAAKLQASGEHTIAQGRFVMVMQQHVSALVSSRITGGGVEPMRRFYKSEQANLCAAIACALPRDDLVDACLCMVSDTFTVANHAGHLLDWRKFLNAALLRRQLAGADAQIRLINTHNLVLTQWIEQGEHDLELALVLVDDGTRLAAQLGDGEATRWFRNMRPIIPALRKEYALAESEFLKLLAEHTSAGYAFDISFCTLSLALLYLMMETPARAITYIERSIVTARQMQHHWNVPKRLAVLAHALLAAASSQSVGSALCQAYEATKIYDVQGDLAIIHAALARLALVLDDIAMATMFAAAMLSQRSRFGAWVGFSGSYFFDITMRELLGSRQDAQTTDAWRHGREAQASEMTARALRWLGEHTA